jgi:tape measure domain-containing protein
MATDVASLLVRIEANTAQLRGELAKADRAVAQATSNMERATQRAQAAIAGIGNGLAGVLGGVAIGALARDIYQTGTQVQDLRKRLETLTGSSAAAAESWEYLQGAANRLSVDVLTLSDSYSKLLPLVQAGLLTTGQAREILEGYGDVAAATGADNNQLAQSMYGLSQGLSAGVLRAEELNQVVEPMPGLLNAIDKAAGLTAGGFRKMVNDGKVTSAMFRDVLMKALKEYEGAAADAADNASKAAIRLNNAWIAVKSTLADLVLPDLARAFEWLSEKVNKSAPALDLFAAWAGIGGSEAAKMKAEVIDLAKRIDATTDSLRVYREQLDRVRERGSEDPEVQALERTIALTETRLGQMREELKLKYAGASGGTPAQTSDAPSPPAAAPVDEKRAKQIAKVIESLRFEQEQIQRTSREQAVYNALKQAGVEITDPEAAGIRRLAEALYDAEQAGKDFAAASEDGLSPMAEFIAGLEEENRLLGLNARERDKVVAVSRAQAIAMKDGNLLREDEIAGIHALVDAKHDLQEATERQKALYDELESFGERAFDRIGSAMTEMAMNGGNAFESLRNIGQAVISELMQEMVKLSLINPLKNALGFNGGTLLPTLASALGGAFSSGTQVYSAPVGPGIDAFASGGLHQGGLRLVGERGPEIEATGPSRIWSAEQTKQMLSGAGSGGGNTYVIDARGADMAAVQRLEAALMHLAGPGKVEQRAISAVADAKARNRMT